MKYGYRPDPMMDRTANDIDTLMPTKVVTGAVSRRGF